MRSAFSWREIWEHAARRMDHSASSVALGPGMFIAGPAHASPTQAIAADAELPTAVGRVRICTKFEGREFAPASLLASMLADGTPVRAKDFSQSWVEGPRMLPSINARPGQRVQLETWVQE